MKKDCKIKGKLTMDSCGDYGIYVPDNTIYSTHDDDYLYWLKLNEKGVEYALKQIKTDEAIPYSNDFFLYEEIPEELEIEVPCEYFEDLDGVIINPSKTDIALVMAVNEGYVLNDKGEAVEPDAEDSPLRKAGLI